VSKPEIILIGAGGHARACIDVIEQGGQYQIAFIVGLPKQRNMLLQGYKVLACDDELEEIAKSYEYALITVGQIQTAEHRIRLYKMALKYGFKLPVIISPSAQVSRHAKVDSGSIVMHGAIVGAGANVGVNCIINTRALIEHDTKVEDNCHISTGALLNGNVTVGSGTFIGSGCVIKDGVVMGKNCLISMGLSIQQNLLSDTRVFNRQVKV